MAAARASSLFIFGCGYSATRYAVLCGPAFASLAGTTRSPDRFAALEAAGVRPLVFDGTDGVTAAGAQLEPGMDVVVSIAPDAGGDPVLSPFAAALEANRPRWIGYLSTVGVYGDHDGAWVDEATPLRPVSTRSVQRVAAEQAWAVFGQRTGVPVAILRLAGIYGPGRNAFVNLRNGTAKRLVKPGQVFNRIHVDDIAAALEAARLQAFSGIINVTDNEPAPPQDVVAFAATLAGIEPPPLQDFGTARLSEMARSFYGENKRVSNRLLRDRLGVALQYPDYRAAHAAMWRNGTFSG